MINFYYFAKIFDQIYTNSEVVRAKSMTLNKIDNQLIIEWDDIEPTYK